MLFDVVVFFLNLLIISKFFFVVKFNVKVVCFILIIKVFWLLRIVLCVRIFVRMWFVRFIVVFFVGIKFFIWVSCIMSVICFM